MATPHRVAPPQGAEVPAPRAAEVIHLDPRRTGGDFSSQVLEEHRLALASLVIPHVTVIRRTPIGEPERVAKSTVYQESVRFSDGAVRLATVVEPDKPATEIRTSSADPWITGDKGFNRTEIDQMAQANLPLVWVHHQARHRVWPMNMERARTVANMSRSKGIAQAAAQEVAAMKSYLGVETLNGLQVMRRGFSRSAQSANAFTVMTEAEGGEVPFSVHEAEVFPHALGWLAMGKGAMRQGRAELTAISSIAADLFGVHVEDGRDTERGSVRDYAGTASLHWQNILNEALWVGKFRSGEAGKYARAVRLSAKGIRLHYDMDEWAHIEDWLDINAPRPGIITAKIPGAHTSGATQEMRASKGQLWAGVAHHALEHGGSLDDMTAYDVLPEKLRRYVVPPSAA